MKARQAKFPSSGKNGLAAAFSPDKPGLSAGQPHPEIGSADASDGELVRRALAGCEISLNALWRRTWPRLLRQLRQHCGHCLFAEDCCQAGCGKALARLAQLGQPEAFYAWVLGFVCHERRHCQRGCPARRAQAAAQVASFAAVASAPSQDLSGLRSELLECLRPLAGRQRRLAVVMLSHYAERERFPTVRQLVRLLGRSHGGVQRDRRAVLRQWRLRLAHLVGCLLTGASLNLEAAPVVNIV